VLPPSARARGAAADIGFGNVVKILRFAPKWWADHGGRDLADLSFLLSDATFPTWWTQHPAGYPVLTGWFAGPKPTECRHLPRPSSSTWGSLHSPRFSSYLRTASRLISLRRERSTGATPRLRVALFLCHAQNTRSAVGAKKTGWWRHIILFWRGALCRPLAAQTAARAQRRGDPHAGQLPLRYRLHRDRIRDRRGAWLTG
jgi:hypothetical protein